MAAIDADPLLGGLEGVLKRGLRRRDVLRLLESARHLHRPLAQHVLPQVEALGEALPVVGDAEVVRRRLRPRQLRLLLDDLRHLGNEEVDVLDLGLDVVEGLAVVQEQVLIRLLLCLDHLRDLEDVLALEVELRGQAKRSATVIRGAAS